MEKPVLSIVFALTGPIMDNLSFSINYNDCKRQLKT